MSFSMLRTRAGRGFTLVEMLVVIAIISILLTAAGPVFDRLGSSHSPGVVATALAGQLERARSHAIAKNTTVWIRLGTVSQEPNDLHVGIFESLDGTNSPATATGVWTGPRFSNLRLSSKLDPSFNRPSVPAANRPDAATWVRFTPSGEAWILPAEASQSRIKMVPPAGDGILARWTEFGLQPTRGGKVPESAKKDVAAIHLAGVTGQTLTFTP